METEKRKNYENYLSESCPFSYGDTAYVRKNGEMIEITFLQMFFSWSEPNQEWEKIFVFRRKDTWAVESVNLNNNAGYFLNTLYKTQEDCKNKANGLAMDTMITVDSYYDYVIRTFPNLRDNLMWSENKLYLARYVPYQGQIYHLKEYIIDVFSENATMNTVKLKLRQSFYSRRHRQSFPAFLTKEEALRYQRLATNNQNK